MDVREMGGSIYTNVHIDLCLHMEENARPICG